jgi:rubrerythrin
VWVLSDEAQVNETIRDWANTVAPDDMSRWEFVCECGDPDCGEHVRLTLDLYDSLRQSSEQVLATGHVFDRARAARARSAELRDEAQAVRNQAHQQTRRLERLGPVRHGYTERVCGECGYAIAVPNPPDACPMCRSTAWR